MDAAGNGMSKQSLIEIQKYIDNSISYTISLDALDFNLLPIHSFLRENDEPMQLWSQDNLSRRYENDYCEFEVMAKETNETVDSISDDSLNDEVSDDISIENNNKYRCHICDTDVPVSFKTQHSNSTIHKIFTTLANIMMERLEKQMGQEIVILNADYINRCAYYCDVCSEVILIRDKEIHEGTEAHKLLMSRDKVVIELIESINNEQLKQIENRNLITADDKKDEKIKECNNNQLESNENPLKPVNNTTDEDIEEVNAKDIYKTDLNVFMDYLKNFCGNIGITVTDSYTVLDDDNIEIKTVNGDRLKIPGDNFNACCRDGIMPLCLLCSERYDIGHMYKPKHIQKIMSPIENKHCIRMIDTMHSHCILCNVILMNDNIQNHTEKTNEDHKARLKAAVVLLVKNFAQNKKKKYFVRNKKRKELKNNNKIKDKTYDEICDKFDFYLKGTRENNGHSNSIAEVINYQMKKSTNANELICKVCKITVPNTTQNINEHIKGQTHTSRYNILVKDNKLSNNDDDYFCEVCKLNVIKETELCHVEKKTHQRNLRATSNSYTQHLLHPPRMTNSNNPKKSNPGRIRCQLEKLGNYPKLYCKICKTTINSLEEHIKDVLHKKAYDTLMNGNKIKLSGDHYICEVCNMQLAKRSKFNHIKNKTHKYNLLSPTDNINKPPSINMDLVHYQMKTVKNSKQLICKICKAKVSRLDRCVDEHVRGKCHKTNYNDLLRRNNINIVQDYYFCASCDATIEKTYELKHIESQSHKYNTYMLSNYLIEDIDE